MSLGEGVVWSTIIALIAIAIWRTTVNKKWKTVGKVVGVLVLGGVLSGVAVWGWGKYQDRPQVLTELAGVTVGMSPVDVTVALGEPAGKETSEREKDGETLTAFFYRRDNDDYALDIVFFGTGKAMRVGIICELGEYKRLLGLATGSTEKTVTDKLGVPGKVSVQKDGLSKIISYPQWKAAYVIEKGMVKGFCASESGTVSYREEYAESTEPKNLSWQDAPLVDAPSE